MTSSVLGAMKAIKVTNFTRKVSKALNNLREDELAAAASFRLMNVITATIGLFTLISQRSLHGMKMLTPPKAYIPQLVSPVVTFAVFVAVTRGKNTSLDATRVFTSLSLLLLVADPLFNLFGGIVDLMTAIACIKRVEEFLTTAPRVDNRTCLGAIEVASPYNCPWISVENGAFGWGDESPRVIQNLNLRVNRGEIIAIVGPVACGKSTLVKGLLGETSTFEGSVLMAHPEISFCDQSPWILVSDSSSSSFLAKLT